MNAYVWDAASARFRNAATGRFVSATDVRRALAVALRASRNEAAGLASALIADEITIDQFAYSMRVLVKDVHLYSAALARGGWQQLDATDFGRVGRLVRDEYTYLDRLLGELDAGTLKLGARLRQRAAMYAEGAIRSYGDAELVSMRAIGKTQERNVLGFAEHCDGPGSCLAETARGWVTIGTLSRPGRRLCLSGCQCHIVYR